MHASDVRLVPFIQRYPFMTTATQGPVSWSDRLSLLLLGLMVTVPFLHPIHHHPIPSFYEEWWAILLGILAALALTVRRPLLIAIPDIIILPGGLLALVMLQWLGGMLNYGEAALLHTSYLAWAALLMVVGASLTNRFGPAVFFRQLAIAVLAGALLSAALAFAQRLHISLPTDVLFPRPSGGMTANIAQPNLLTSYLWMGIAAAVWLKESGSLKTRSAVFAVVFIGCGAGLTGSRIAVVHGLALLMLAFLYQRHVLGNQHWLRTSLLAAGLLGVFTGGLASRHLLPGFDATEGSLSAMERLSPMTISGDARLDLWRDTLMIVGDHPMTGNGVGNFPWRMVEAAAVAPMGANTYPGAEHAHNIVLQLAADFGIPAMLLAAAVLIRWTGRAWQSSSDPARRWGFDLLALLGLHSLFEYPLWYADFLGLAALALGALTAAPRRFEYPRSRHILPIALACAALATLPLRIDYGQLDSATNFPPQHHPTDEEWKQRIATVARLSTHSALAAYANIALGALLEPDKTLAEKQSYVCERAMRIWPEPSLLTRCAVLRQLSGRPQEATALLRLISAAYRGPGQQAIVDEVLRTAKRKNPETASLGVFLRDKSKD